MDFNDQEILLRDRVFNSGKNTPIKFKVLKLDYTKIVSDKFSFETGLKGTLSTFINELNLREKNNGVEVFDPRFTDEGDMDEKIAASYFSTDYKFNDRLTGKFGLRYEYYDSKLNSQNDGTIVDRQFGRLFPSLYFTYQPNDIHQFQLSYSERINRPSFNQLASFFLFWGPNTVFTGNAGVQPTISKQINASYRYKSLLFSFEFSDFDAPLTYQPILDAGENFFLVNPVNMQDGKNAMFSVNAPWQITKWWESRYNVSLGWTLLKPEFDGETITQSGFYYMANTSQIFSLPKGFTLEMNGSINSPRKWGLGQGKMYASLNLGIQKSIFSDTKISLNWSNMFSLGSIWQFEFDQPEINLDYTWEYQMEPNIIRLSISKQFGSKNVKSASKRKTGSEEERSRLNSTKSPFSIIYYFSFF